MHDVFRVADLRPAAAALPGVAQPEEPLAKVPRRESSQFCISPCEEVVAHDALHGWPKLSASQGADAADRLKWSNKGRRLRAPDRLLPFAQLYVLGGLRKYRRGPCRHAIEKPGIWRHLA